MRYLSISHFVKLYNNRVKFNWVILQNRYLVITSIEEGLTERQDIMRLKDIREDRDLTQKEVAQYLHVKQNSYSQYENGQRQLPIDILISLAKYYKVSTDYILCLTDDPKPYPKSK